MKFKILSSFILITVFLLLLFVDFYGPLLINYFNAHFADGAFQIYNPLRRLSNNQTYGKDFHFFHGPGTLFLHYPLFVIFGKNFYALKMTLSYTSLVIFYLSIFLILYSLNLTFRQIIFFIIFFNLVLKKFFVFEPLIYPGNSYFGVRTGLILIFFLLSFS